MLAVPVDPTGRLHAHLRHQCKKEKKSDPCGGAAADRTQTGRSQDKGAPRNQAAIGKASKDEATVCDSHKPWINRLGYRANEAPNCLGMPVEKW